MVFPFILSSCSKDDNYSNSDIVGTWILSHCTVKEVKTNNDKATQAIQHDIVTYSDDEMLSFTEDGKFISSEGNGTYSLNGNKLTLTAYGESKTVTVNLSDNTFSVDVDETEYYQDEIEYLVPNEKNVIVSKVITTYTYEKK
jgi:hypothetical protein